MGNTRHHPLTGAPIVPLGYRKDGRPIFPIMGASDDPPPADPPQDPPPANDPSTDPPKDPDDGKGGKDAILADLAKERDKRQGLEAQLTELQGAQQQQMDAITKALGLKSEDAPPDPAALASQIETEKSGRLAAERDLAVYRAASDPEVGANASRLLDSTRFRDSIRDIDPTDTAALSAAIKAAVEADDMFKAAQPAASPPFPGGPRTPAPKTAGSLGEAIAGRLSSTNR